MVIARATLAYGLTVRSASLFFAADAWTRLPRTLSFFDLVFLRRKNGGLVTSQVDGGGPGSVTKVPNEVWEAIRYWVFREEVAASEERLLRSLTCGVAKNNCRTEIWTKSVTWEEFVESPEGYCVYCYENLANWVDGKTVSCKQSGILRMKAVLNAFGLDLPSHQAVLPLGDRSWWSDLHASALISAPSGFEEGRAATPFVEVGYGARSNEAEHTLVDVSFTGLPTNIDQRFFRFVRFFNLLVVDSSVNKIVPRPTSDDEEDRKMAVTGGNRDKVTKEIKPSWRLYLMCEGDDDW